MRNVSCNSDEYECEDLTQEMTYQDTLSMVDYLNSEVPDIKLEICSGKESGNTWSVRFPKKQEKKARILIKIYRSYGNIELYKKRQKQISKQWQKDQQSRAELQNFKILAESFIECYSEYMDDESYAWDISDISDFIMKIMSSASELTDYQVASIEDLYNDNQLLLKLDVNDEFYYLENPYKKSSIKEQKLSEILWRVYKILDGGLSFYDSDIRYSSDIWRTGLSYNGANGKELLALLMALYRDENSIIEYRDDQISLINVINNTNAAGSDVSIDKQNMNIKEIDEQIEEEVNEKNELEARGKAIKEGLEFLQSKMSFVKVINHGIRFRNKKVAIKDMIDALGIDNVEIRKQFEARWNIFTDIDEIKQLSIKLEAKVNRIKERNLIKVGNYEWILLTKNKESWKKDIDKFIKSDMNRTRGKFKELNKVLDKSGNNLKKLIGDEFIKTIEHSGKKITEEKFTELIEMWTRDINNELTNVEKLCENIYIEEQPYGITEDYLRDPYFCFELAAKSYLIDEEISNFLIKYTDKNWDDLIERVNDIKKEKIIKISNKIDKLFSSETKINLGSGFSPIKLIDSNEGTISINRNSEFAAIYDKNKRIVYAKSMHSLQYKLFLDNLTVAVKDIAISSKYLAILFNNGCIDILNVYDKKLVNRFNLNDDLLTRINFSPDSRIINACGIGTIYQININDEKIKRIELKDELIESIDFTRDGRYILAGGAKGIIHIIDPQFFKVITSIAQYDYKLIDASFSYDDNEILAVYADGKLRRLDVIDGDVIYESKLIPGLKIARYLHDGQYILMIAEEIAITDLRGNVLYRLDQEINYFDILGISELEQCALLGYYFGFTDKCFEVVNKDDDKSKK